MFVWGSTWMGLLVWVTSLIWFVLLCGFFLMFGVRVLFISCLLCLCRVSLLLLFGLSDFGFLVCVGLVVMLLLGFLPLFACLFYLDAVSCDLNWMIRVFNYLII